MLGDAYNNYAFIAPHHIKIVTLRSSVGSSFSAQIISTSGPGADPAEEIGIRDGADANNRFGYWRLSIQNYISLW